MLLNQAPIAKTSRLEITAVVALLLGILIFNLLTALRYPLVWMDEVMFTDPAANLAMGNGFISTAWSIPSADAFWAGNVPLHELVLSGWIKVFGFSPLAVRSINYVWFVLGTFLLWLFCVRAQILKQTWLRLLLILLLACGSGISFSYRSGRADMIDFFLATLALFATTVPNTSVRTLSLFIIGIFFPLAGLQLLPFLFIVTLLVLVFWGWRAALNGVFVGLGACIGLTMLYIIYQHYHVWNDFRASVVRLGTDPQIYGHAQLSAVPEVLMRDRSAPLLLTLTIILIWNCWQSRNASGSKLALFAFFAGLCIPVGMHFIGNFPIYYGWMAALPVTLAICQCVSVQTLAFHRQKIIIGFFLVAAMLIGLPIRIGAAMLFSPDLSHTEAEHFISAHLKSSDEVYIDYPAFYPAKKTAKKIYMAEYTESVMTTEEKKSVTALIASSSGFSWLTNQIPGNWKVDATFNTNAPVHWLPKCLQRFESPNARGIHTPYHFVIYRRVSDSSHN